MRANSITPNNGSGDGCFICDKPLDHVRVKLPKVGSHFAHRTCALRFIDWHRKNRPDMKEFMVMEWGLSQGLQQELFTS